MSEKKELTRSEEVRLRRDKEKNTANETGCKTSNTFCAAGHNARQRDDSRSEAAIAAQYPPPLPDRPADPQR